MTKQTKQNVRLSVRKTDRRLSIYDFAGKVIMWLSLSLEKDEASIPSALLLELCKKLSLRLKSRGIRDTLSYVKATRSNLYNYLSGNILRNKDSPCYGAAQFPSILGPLKQYIDDPKHTNTVRLLLTILNASRALKLKGEVDTSSITQPIKGDVPDITQHMPAFWKDLGYRVNTGKLPRSFQSVKWLMYRLSRGPNGHALLGAAYEATILPKSLINSLEVLAPGMACRIQGCIDGLILTFQCVWATWPERERESIRKVSSFPDKEGKMRTVGILDYWSQMALKPIHDYLARILSKINQDCTLDQSKFRKLLENVDCKYYSVDLSSATDRFPIQVIKQLLECRLPRTFVDAWADVMVGYPFDFQKDKLIYATGNPMGAYSSFNSFAFAHHYLIYYCCKELSTDWKSLPYSMLGDDIVIGNEAIAEMYMSLLSSLHVDYSPAKTHQSKDFYEFAKRIIYKKEEISPFPISALFTAQKSSDTLVTVLRAAKERGWKLGNISSSVRLYFSLVKEYRSKVCKKIEVDALCFDAVLSLTQGAVSAVDVFNDMAGKNGHQAIFKPWMESDLLHYTSIAYMRMLQSNIASVLKEVTGYKLSSVMKSNDILKSYYAFTNVLAGIDSNEYIGFKSFARNHLIINSPIYGAIYALEDELKLERKRVRGFVDSNSQLFDKKLVKPRMEKLRISVLFDLSKDNKKVVNTVRQFYNILNEEVINAYWSYYEGNTFSGLIQAGAYRKLLQETVKG